MSLKQVPLEISTQEKAGCVFESPRLCAEKQMFKHPRKLPLLQFPGKHAIEYNQQHPQEMQ